jgi:N-acetylmuramoyl-L-alanine amidase
VFTLGETNPTIEEAQRLLAQYGYDVSPSGYFDARTRDAVAAFQRHFRRQRVDGMIDPSTLATLRALVAARDNLLNGGRPG